MLRLLANVTVLAIGSLILSFSMMPSKERRFSVPIGNIVYVTLFGGWLAYWYGWVSTGIVLGTYFVYRLGTDLVEWRSTR